MAPGRIHKCRPWCHFIIIAKRFFGYLKVPNLKFMKVNNDLTISEIMVNRYTGYLITDPKQFGTYNFCKTTDYTENIVEQGYLPSDGTHKTLDIDPHNLWGDAYTHVSTNIKVPYNGEKIKVLYDTDSILLNYLINVFFSVFFFVLFIYIYKFSIYLYQKIIIKFKA